MNTSGNIEGTAYSEISLQALVRRIWEKKWWFALSISTCLAIAYLMIKTAVPIYEVGATMLIDPSGQSRMLGESQYVDGGVGLIGTEKNLYNEIGILTSYSLVEETIAELDFGISYYAGKWYKMIEQYGYFPFEVELVDSSAQLYGTPFSVKMLSDEKYSLSIEAKEFYVSDPLSNTIREVKRDFKFSKTYQFGEVVQHDYFNFIIQKPSYQVITEDFEDKDLSFVVNSIEDLANYFKNKLEVAKTDIKADILRLDTEGPVVAKEIKFIQRLCENFIKSKFSERNEIAASKEDFIRSQLAGVSDSLSKAERRLESFKSSSNAVNLDLTASNNLEQINQLESSKGQIELNIQYYTSLVQYISSKDDFDKIIAPSAVGIEDPLLNENLLELKRLISKKTELAYYKGAKSYDLEVIDKQIKNTSNALIENLKNLIETAQLNLRDKNQRIAKLEQRMSRLPGSEKLLLNYQRKNDLYENLYNYLNQELAKTSIARAEDIADTRVLDPPRMMGSGPVSPNKLLTMAVGLVLGCFFPFVFVLFSGSLGGTIDRDNQLESLTPIPVAARINHQKKVKGVTLSHAKHRFVEESFRDLGANLQFLVPDTEKNIIGLTSMIPGEGKTFCATHLGMGLANAGKKTLLLDLDFREPALLKDQYDEYGCGLEEYLSEGTIPLEEIIRPYPDLPNLHFISTKQEVANPHRLLSNPKLKTLLTALRFDYDYIILDSPAVGLVSDYLLISKFVDIHLFVIRRKMSRLSFLNEIEHLRNKGNMEHSYLVFNDVKSRANGMGKYHKH